MTLDCQETRDHFGDLIDERLSESRRRSVDEHLAGCEDCREDLAGLESLLAESRRLPREIEPPRNLWPGIESRLAPRPRGLGTRLANLLPDWSEAFSPQSLAVAAAALALVTLGALLWRNAPDGSEALPAVAESTIMTEAAVTQRAELARSEDGVLLARQNLIEAVEGPKEHLSPETVAVIEENMRVIDQAIGQISSALEDDPLNHQLNMLLAAQYQQEAELLKRVSGV